MALKVDFLLKQELQYELTLRGVSFEDSVGVRELRKLMRYVLKLNVKPNALNLKDYINLKEEVQIIEINASELKTKIEDLKIEPELNSVIRAEHKIRHYVNRIKNLLSFKMEESVKTKLVKLTETLENASEELSNLGLDQTEKETVERKLSESILEEDELEDVFEKIVNIVNKNSVQATSVNELVVNHEDKLFTFSKLPNPVEVYLKNFKTCDGLDVRKLLEFLKNILRMK